MCSSERQAAATAAANGMLGSGRGQHHGGPAGDRHGCTTSKLERELGRAGEESSGQASCWRGSRGSGASELVVGGGGFRATHESGRRPILAWAYSDHPLSPLMTLANLVVHCHPFDFCLK